MTETPAPDIGVIMVPVDMEEKERSGNALAMAARLARNFSAKLYVMTAAHPLGDDVAEYPEHHKPDFQSFIDKIAKAYRIGVEPLFRSHESPEKMILDTAEEVKADLIVMATHDPKFADRFFGSHASHVALRAHCSVMAVR
jgi:nucleotide-binding universal stress UspA family protein